MDGGPRAHVTAIDIDTRFIDSLASDSIEVRRVDLREDELPQDEFDLVHARLVLEHLTDRRQILDRLVATLRPGGWIVIEDYGRRVVSDMEAAGLTDIRGEGRARLIDSTSPGFDFFRLSFESLRGAVVAAGLLSAEEAEAAAGGFDGHCRLLTPMMMAGIGRRS